jgi:hypothetical protein
MNSRERVLKVLDHREADRVPVIMCGNHAGISKLAYDKLCRYLGKRFTQIPDGNTVNSIGILNPRKYSYTPCISGIIYASFTEWESKREGR